MDRENLWTRRSNLNKPSLSNLSPDNRDTKGENGGKSVLSSKRTQANEINTPGKPSVNGGPSINSNNTASPGASAFGLGSGAFASFGSATKTPKTPGTAFDFNKATSNVTPSAEAERDTKSSRSSSNLLQQSQRDQPVTNSKEEWPLKYTWVMWYRPPTSKNSDYEKSIKPMYRVATAQEFWKVYTHLKRPSALPTVSDYHFFKDGIRPVWEDEENKRGGKWIIRLKKGVIDRYWDDMLLAVIGDQFAEAGEEVCGMVVSVRSGEDVLSVWTKIDGGRNIKIRETIKRVLSLPSDTIIIWKSHDDSIAQRSAIDQARYEKGSYQGTEKRRGTASEQTPTTRERPGAT